MTDIPVAAGNARPRGRGATPQSAADGAAQGDDALIAYVELLFFAYRDFTAGPDAVLQAYGFGRAHHRVLHFVCRRPGLRIADLLDILKITKQSLARVLRQLVDDGFVALEEAAEDRRARRLFATAKGRRLASRLADLQVARIRSALADAGADAPPALRRFLAAMIRPEDRAGVLSTLGGPGAGLPPEPPTRRARGD